MSVVVGIEVPGWNSANWRGGGGVHVNEFLLRDGAGTDGRSKCKPTARYLGFIGE